MTRIQIAEKVRAWRYDTVLARAFRRALSIEQPAPKPRRRRGRRRGGSYKGMRECFENREHVDSGV